MASMAPRLNLYPPPSYCHRFDHDRHHLDHSDHLDHHVHCKTLFRNTITDGGSTETHSKVICGWTGLDRTKKASLPRAPCGAKKTLCPQNDAKSLFALMSNLNSRWHQRCVSKAGKRDEMSGGQLKQSFRTSMILSRMTTECCTMLIILW